MCGVVAVLTACGGNDEPRCAAAVGKLAERLGDADSPRVAMLIGTCEQKRWPREVRTCLAEATTAAIAAKCVPVAPVDLGPTPVPSPSVKTQATTGKVRALLFAAPEPHPVVDALLAYLAAAKIPVERIDRIVDAGRSAKYRVIRDGTIVLVRDMPDGERTATIGMELEPKRARRKLARLDRKVAVSIVKLLREKRKVYVTTGHGELHDDRVPDRRHKSFDQRLGDLNFEGLLLDAATLATAVPQGATVVAILAPTTAFSEAEQQALVRYLDQGGALLLALDPKGIPSMGALDGKLGVKLAPGHLTDDKSFLPQRGARSDFRLALTSKFSAHASTTSLSRTVNQGLVLIDAAALEAVPSPAKKTITIRTMDTSFLDLDDDFTFDDGKEQRRSFDFAAAIEDKFKAIVTADVDLFVDVIAQNAGRASVMMVGRPFFDDALRWLGGEEAFTGEVVDDDEPDPPAEKKKSQRSGALDGLFGD
jgi:hypothetical protein